MAVNPAGGGKPSSSVANFPGFNYLARVASAANRAVDAHAELLNDAWSQMRDGTYTPEQALKTWSRVTDNYVGVATEAWRVSNVGPAPSWFLIPYSKKDPKLNYSVPIDQVLEKTADLDVTSFQSMGAWPSIPPQNMLKDGRVRAAGTRIEFDLNQAALAVDVGNSYQAFVFRKGGGAAPPLAAIVVQITA